MRGGMHSPAKNKKKKKEKEENQMSKKQKKMQLKYCRTDIELGVSVHFITRYIVAIKNTEEYVQDQVRCN